MKLGSPLSFYVRFVLEKPLCKKLNFFFNRSKDVAHCCFPCLASLDKDSTNVRQEQTYTMRQTRSALARDKDRLIRCVKQGAR